MKIDMHSGWESGTFLEQQILEEDQKKYQTPEKDDIQGTVQTEDNSHVELEDGIEPKEAWTITQKKLAKASPLTMLMTIGKA